MREEEGLNTNTREEGLIEEDIPIEDEEVNNYRKRRRRMTKEERKN
jgi:hypothetical protein